MAVLLVIFFHVHLNFVSRGMAPEVPGLDLLDQGHIGVSLFMVISGYILSRIALRGEFDVRRFFLNRILRIYPLFSLVIVLGYFSTPDPRPPAAGINLILSLLPISNLYRTSYGQFGDSLWSIAVELQFYLLFPVLLLTRKRYGLSAYAVLLLFLIVIRTLVFLVNGTVHQLSFFSIFGGLDAFVFGCIAADLQERFGAAPITPLAPLAAAVAIAAVTLAAFRHRSFFHVDYGQVTPDHVSRSAVWIIWPCVQGALWAVLLVTYLRSRAGLPGTRLLAWLGKISYSMYAWHILIIFVLLARVVPIPWVSPYLFGLLVVLPPTILFSALTFYAVERPFLQLRVSYVREPGGSPERV